MTSLIVKEFSCIESAQITLGRLTIIIGPQASGKSVLTKLMYFFTDAVNNHLDFAEPILSSSELRSHITEQFRKWFPQTAWGEGRFLLHYTHGPFSVTIERGRPYKVPSKTFTVKFSKAFEDHLSWLQSLYREAIRNSSSPDDHVGGRLDFRIQYQIENQNRSKLAALMGDSHIDYQIFVPAGRAFFTSIGKAIAVFEHSNSLDPLTLEFGRFWGSVRDRRYGSGISLDTDHNDNELVRDIFGGNIVRDRDVEYVVSSDGRRVPITSLSSGQQELFPLWMAVHFYFGRDPAQTSRASRLMYIEEPEAHLFPEAQADLIQYLACRMNASAGGRRMILTTHSPYVLSKINNLVLAGNLADGGNKNVTQQVRQIIPANAWLSTDMVAAYAIQDRKVRSIVGEEGLIEADYLDDVSGAILDEFSNLASLQEA